MNTKMTFNIEKLNSEMRIYQLPLSQWWQWILMAAFGIFGIILLASSLYLGAIIFIAAILLIKPLYSSFEDKPKVAFILNRKGMHIYENTFIPWHAVQSIKYNFKPQTLKESYVFGGEINTRYASMEISYVDKEIRKEDVSLHGCDHEVQEITDIIDTFHQRYSGPQYQAL